MATNLPMNKVTAVIHISTECEIHKEGEVPEGHFCVVGQLLDPTLPLET